MKNKNNSMLEQQKDSYLEAENAAYLEALYHDYCQGKEIADPAIFAYFESILPPDAHEADHPAIMDEFIDLARVGANGVRPCVSATTQGVYDVVNAFRSYGHRLANLDPLGLSKPIGHPKLSLDYFNLQNDAEAKAIFE